MPNAECHAPAPGIIGHGRTRSTRAARSGRPAPPETWGHSTVRTACPLDCPDACTLDVTVENGRVKKIDGGDDNPVTRNFICAKVRRFAERVYGEDRVLYPSVRQGAKGAGHVRPRHLGRGARPDRAPHDRDQGRPHGGEAILPYYYGGSNGPLTHSTNDAELWRRFGTSRLATTVCAAPTGAANLALYGKMPSVVYQDYPHAKLIILWGVNPSASGIHLDSVHQGSAGRRRHARRHRSTDDVAGQEARTCTSPSGPARTCRWRSRCIA